MKLNLVYTIEYTVGVEDCNMNETLDSLRQYGDAKIVDVKVVKEKEKSNEQD